MSNVYLLKGFNCLHTMFILNIERKRNDETFYGQILALMKMDVKSLLYQQTFSRTCIVKLKFRLFLPL